MTPPLLAAALVLLLVGAAGAAGTRGSRAALGFSAVSGGLACALGVTASVLQLFDGAERTWRIDWSPPIGTLSIGIDALSAFFVLCIFLVGGLAVVYAAGYFAASRNAGPVGRAVAWLQVLITAMVMVVLARDVIVFLVAWEAMFLCSYFLVTFEAHDERVRAAGFTYLVASHISVVLLFVLFGLLVRHANSVEFAAFAAAAPVGLMANVCFVVALAGFGIKAGMWPLHGWLPEAHPAAPSPVSALMSGVMIKMGIYGLLRALTLLGPPPLSWGIALLAVGASSALAGVLLALAQHDLKRLLAYHSVENIGIIALGIGIGLIGKAAHAPAVAVAGFGGALLHTLNHGLFKGLLFQAVGAVRHATGSVDMGAQGGLLRRMPLTGTLFLIGAAAISGLPPLNGFVSEWLIYVGALRQAVAGGPREVAASAAMVVPVLALVGGLAAACFTKVVGVVFLGEPRSPHSAGAHEIAGPMRVSMLLGAVACVAIGVAPVAALQLVVAPATLLVGSGVTPAPVAPASLYTLSLIATLFAAIIVLLLVGRHLLLRRRERRAAVTWDCGYVRPTPRMQYSAASFAEPVLEPFLPLLHARIHRTPVEGLFPRAAAEDTHLEDPGEAAVRWGLAAAFSLLTRMRALQRGPVQLYLLYVLITLLVLLVWQVRT